MVDTGQPPPGGGTKLNQSLFNAMTPAQGGDSTDSSFCKMRNFAEILNEDQQHRNILEVKLYKTSETLDNGEIVKVKTLNEADLSEFLFDIMELKMEDCEGIGLRTYRYDTKEIKLKKGVDPSPYITSTPKLFKGHEITIHKQSNNLTRVSFKNVPFNIPDEEIVHLCKCYGEPLRNKVTYEKASRLTRGVQGSTRYVDMKLNPGVQFENYYWMEGPLSGDLGCRITVLHNGQVQQCSHCLRRANFCPGGGNGKACESLKTERGKMGDYMKYLKEKHGYISLKMQYLQMQFPALGGSKDQEDGFGHMEEGVDLTENSEDSVSLESLKKQVSDMNMIQQQLLETKAQLALEQKSSKTAKLKLKHVEKVASQRIVECMPDLNFENDSNHLTMLLATVMENEDFDYDEDKDLVKPKVSDDFLKIIEKSCDEVPDKEQKLKVVRNKVLEKMKKTLRRERGKSIGSCSISSVGSITSSKTRPRSKDGETESEKDPKWFKHQASSQEEKGAEGAQAQQPSGTPSDCN